MAKAGRTLTYQGDMLVHDSYDDISMADGAYSWQFDGNTQSVFIPHNTVLDFSNSNWTIEFWICPTATDAIGRAIFSKRASAAIGASVNIQVDGSAGKFYILVAPTTQTGNWAVVDTTTVPADIGVWQHFALVRSGINIYAYKDVDNPTQFLKWPRNSLDRCFFVEWVDRVRKRRRWIAY